MKQETYTLVGRDVQVTVPESIDEVVNRIGAERALSLLVDYVVYHSLATQVRNKLAARLHKKTNVDRLRDEDNNIVESPTEYVARLVRDGVITDYTEDLQQTVDEIDFFACATATRRVAAPAAPSKSALAVVAKAASKPGGRESLAAKLAEKLGRQFNPNDDNDLAAGVQEVQRRVRAELKRLNAEMSQALVS